MSKINLNEAEKESVEEAIQERQDVETLRSILDKGVKFESNCKIHASSTSDQIKQYLIENWSEYLDRPAYVDGTNDIFVLVISDATHSGGFCSILRKAYFLSS